MSNQIKVNKPLVILHGDEMAQIAFDQVLNQFVRKQLNIELVEIDLSAENRLLTNGQIVLDSIEALNKYGVGIKNAGMTVNKTQLTELLEKHPQIDGTKLHPLATKSPNGAIRKGISGNITREDIPFKNLVRPRPEWIGRDIVVDTMENGGNKESDNALAEVIKTLCKTYPMLTHEKITGHEHIAPGRKTDPGPYFDWQKLTKMLERQT